MFRPLPLALFCIAPLGAFAAESALSRADAGLEATARPQQASSGELALSLGPFGLRQEHATTFGVQLELRAGWGLFGLHPFAGLLTSSGGATYVFAGLALEIPLGSGWRLTPSFAPGFYAHGGDRDLGYPLEFRSCLSISARVSRTVRVGVSGLHMSNATLSRHNPGVEVVSLEVAWVFGQGPASATGGPGVSVP